MTRRIPQRVDRQVRARARNGCEYCRLPQATSKLAFEVEHVIARKHGGADALDNLALACPYCNRFKGPNIAGIDPATGQVTALFNPRTDVWHEHFHWEGPTLVGLTPIGRATVVVLSINHPPLVAAREMLLAEGIFPPD